ncbi:NADH-ubiquinone oxidoreductase [Niveomyces insectorum RCEF 264]|uniref:NADH-ubiquinone oxidoreductase n=1 Tax=Niveomyces insectorum RCEF 264 TaxID=1081102 RepID=A0A167TUD3_9HYPO|nr:NADH-ubiquinone oxidoreductase [Niveomyces insectorum RCEF 264]
MLPIRQRAVCMARLARLRRPATATPAVRFASTDSHSHDHGHGESHAPVDEPMGSAFFIALAAIPASWLLYTLTRPGKDGEPAALSTYINKFSYLTEQWENRNTLHTAAIEQAAHDKNLLYTVDRNTHIDLRFPEVFQTGSPYNVPAGHSVNLDKVVAHYREQHHKEAARQAKAAAAAREEKKE